MNRLAPEVRRTIAVVFLGPFMTQLDATLVNVSLPTIREEMNTSFAAAQWVIGGYLLALALILPLNGWLVDRIGAKRLYLACFTAFTGASMLCGAARDIDALVAARVLQGVAGGLLTPMTTLMIARVAGNQMARAMGFGAAPVLIAPIVGPVLAGAILKHASWRWLFLLNLPVGLVALITAFVLLPDDAHATRKQPFDFLGFGLLSPGLACALYGFERAAHHEGFGPLIAGVALLLGFGVHVRRSRSAAFMDFGLFKNATFLAATRTQFLSNGVIYAGQLLVPLFLATGCGLTTAQTGWMFAALGVGMMVSYPFMGLLTERLGCRAVSVAGIALQTASTLPFIWMSTHPFSPLIAYACLFARGVGQGATGIPSSSAAYTSVPKNKLPVGTTTINIVQRLGGPTATTAMGIVISLSMLYLPTGGPDVFMVPFMALVALQVLTCMAAWRLPGNAAVA